MITKTLYVCDICHTSYADKKECEKCEKSHIEPIGITAKKYLPIKNDVTGYPINIEVEFADGKVKRYTRG